MFWPQCVNAVKYNHSNFRIKGLYVFQILQVSPAHGCKYSHISIHAWIIRAQDSYEASYCFRGTIRCHSSHPIRTETNHFSSSLQPFCKASPQSQVETWPTTMTSRATMTSPAFWSRPLPWRSGPLHCAWLGAPGASRVSICPAVHMVRRGRWVLPWLLRLPGPCSSFLPKRIVFHRRLDSMLPSILISFSSSIQALYERNRSFLFLLKQKRWWPSSQATTSP